MFCAKCGTQLNDDMAFCPKCGCKITNNAQHQTAPQQMKNNAVYETASSQAMNNKYSKAENKVIKRKVPVWALVLPVIVVVGIFLYLNRNLNLSKFDETNGNAISTSWFKEFASNEDYFKSYSCSDYTKKGNTSGGHAVLEQEARSIEHGPLQGIYLLTYENENALQEYAYNDILRIIRGNLDTNIAAFKSPSDDFYYFDCPGGAFGDHTYCFWLVGNSMVYAVKFSADDEPNAIKYLSDLDTEGMFDLPEFGNYEVVSFTQQFIEDANQNVEMIEDVVNGLSGGTQ